MARTGIGNSGGLEREADMMGRMANDFAGVRVHTSPREAKNVQLGAQAYTQGSHIAFGGAGGGQQLLGHELTHVVQQQHGQVKDAQQLGNVVRLHAQLKQGG